VTARDIVLKKQQVRAMLGLAIDDMRMLFRASASINPRVLIDCYGNKWDIIYGCGWVSIHRRGSNLRVTAANLSDIVVFYKESELIEWRKGTNEC
jgi:hypothetical protein